MIINNTNELENNTGLDNNCNYYSDDYIYDNIVILKSDEINNCRINKTMFQEGVNEFSKLCGKISALCSVGITPSMALSYISDKEANESLEEINLKISELNANATIESSKYNSVGMQKMMI